LPGLTVMSPRRAQGLQPQPGGLELGGRGVVGQVAGDGDMVGAMGLEVGDHRRQHLGPVFAVLATPGDATEQPFGQQVPPAERALGRRQVRVREVREAEYRQDWSHGFWRKGPKLLINRLGFQGVVSTVSVENDPGEA
jgi:hypothetical protein